MWEAATRGRPLTFRLVGINNQNFVMRDEETGSWWQQVTGEAILGPLQGQRLRLVPHDELTFGLWKREQPAGRVLRPDEAIARAGLYAPANWEDRIAAMPVATIARPDSALEPRTLIVGIDVGVASKAYPFDALVRQSPVVDEVGGTPILVVVGDDGRSVRAFDRMIDGKALQLFAKPDVSPLRLVDADTGSEWDFTGEAVAGPLAGRRLQKLTALKDYWFDWKAYHPDTEVYRLGGR